MNQPVSIHLVVELRISILVFPISVMEGFRDFDMDKAQQHAITTLQTLSWRLFAICAGFLLAPGSIRCMLYYLP